MMQLEYKTAINNLKTKIRIIKMNIGFSFRQETSYLSKSVGIVITSLIFASTIVLSMEVLYSHIDSIAGYSKDEMLMFIAIGQVSFMFNINFLNGNIYNLINDVNTGGLDLVLTKPFPHLFYVSYRSLYFLSFLRDMINVIFIFFIIDFSNISFTLPALLIASLIFIFGMLALSAFQFITSLPVFWVGQSAAIFNLTWVFEYDIGRVFPVEALSRGAQFTFTYIIPVIIPVGFTTSVLLGKSDPVIMLVISFSAYLIFAILKKILWKKALLNYTSASS